MALLSAVTEHNYQEDPFSKLTPPFAPIPSPSPVSPSLLPPRARRLLPRPSLRPHFPTSQRRPIAYHWSVLPRVFTLLQFSLYTLLRSKPFSSASVCFADCFHPPPLPLLSSSLPSSHLSLLIYGNFSSLTACFISPSACTVSGPALQPFEAPLCCVCTWPPPPPPTPAPPLPPSSFFFIPNKEPIRVPCWRQCPSILCAGHLCSECRHRSAPRGWSRLLSPSLPTAPQCGESSRRRGDWPAKGDCGKCKGSDGEVSGSGWRQDCGGVCRAKEDIKRQRARPGDGDGECWMEGGRGKDTARTVQRKESGVGGGKCTQGQTTRIEAHTHSLTRMHTCMHTPAQICLRSLAVRKLPTTVKLCQF